MVAQEFIQQLDKIRFVQSVGLDDFADRAAYLLSFVLLVICFIIVTIKSYVLEPLSCYIPTTFSGSGMPGFISAFCWVNGTVPISANTSRLEDSDYWNVLENRKMNYYQWVSIVLALQAIMCYFPRLIWETIIFNRVGTNLTYLIENAQVASRETGQERKRKVGFVANTMDTLLFARRNLKNGLSASTLRHRLASLLLDLVPRKRLGTALASYYGMIKMLYLFNSIGQIILIEKFIGAKGKLYGIQAVNAFVNGMHWSESEIFPRVGFCRVPIKIANVKLTHLVAQCSLPVNMLNEKIYIFLWFWFCLVAAMELASVCMWINRLAIRQKRVHNLVKHLKIADVYNDDMVPLIKRFELTFLRLDGTFLLYMLRLNAGDIITHEILQTMLQRFVDEESKKRPVKNEKLLESKPKKDARQEIGTTLLGSLDQETNLKKRENVI
ncbi:Innexin inx2 [Cichlidogyrus casuarinus]|uniref:Innexin n=1 Tax=Cichlidogyrus casuarinus TaxID=1844966 RepID=A0ABD2PYM6_9PLAT